MPVDCLPTVSVAVSSASQECRHPWRETVEGMGNGQKDDTYKSLVMRFNIFTLQIQISLSTEYICTSHILCFIIQCC